MATSTNLGSMKDIRISRIRDSIYNELMEGSIQNKNYDIEAEQFLNREVLFFVLINNGIDKNSASFLTTKVYGQGRKITSKYLTELFANTPNELGQKQFKRFIHRFMSSTRIETINDTPYTWIMNGYSNFERPNIVGFDMKDDIKKKVYTEKLNNINKKILEINEKFKNGNVEVTQLHERDKLIVEMNRIKKQIN